MRTKTGLFYFRKGSNDAIKHMAALRALRRPKGGAAHPRAVRPPYQPLEEMPYEPLDDNVLARHALIPELDDATLATVRRAFAGHNEMALDNLLLNQEHERRLMDRAAFAADRIQQLAGRHASQSGPRNIRRRLI